MVKVLVLYYSETGATAALAQEIAQGAASVAGVQVILRTVPKIGCVGQAMSSHGVAFVQPEDVADCAGIALGSPIHYGQMAAALSHFFAQHVALWSSGALMDKPAIVFASGSSLHGGQEASLLTMMLMLLHYGAVLCGIPYRESALKATKTGGTPYGATHVGLSDMLSEDERILAKAQGARLAQWALMAEKGGKNESND